MPTEEEIQRQIRWEMEGIRRAAEHYREATKARDPVTLPSAQRLLREVAPPLIDAIKSAQEEAVQQLGSPGRASPWAELILLVDAEKLPVITIVSALRAGVDPRQDERTHLPDILNLSIEIADVVRDQIELDRWEAEQKAANKAARQTGDLDHDDQLALFRKRYPNAGRRDWAKWRQKIGLAREEAWDKPRKVQIGSALIDCLLRAVPQRFERKLCRIEGGKTLACLQLSDDTQEMMRDIEARRASPGLEGCQCGYRRSLGRTSMMGALPEAITSSRRTAFALADPTFTPRHSSRSEWISCRPGPSVASSQYSLLLRAGNATGASPPAAAWRKRRALQARNAPP